MQIVQLGHIVFTFLICTVGYWKTEGTTEKEPYLTLFGQDNGL